MSADRHNGDEFLEDEEFLEEEGAVKERTIDTTDSLALSILLKDKDMFHFLLRHNYTNLSGVIGVVLSLGALILIALFYRSLSSERIVALAILATLFTIVQPLQLKSKAKKQIKRNEMFAVPLQYHIAEEGFVICQGEQFVEVKWQDVRKVVRTKGARYIYLSTIRAFIFPKEQCGNRWEEFCQMVDRKTKGR